MLRNLSSVVGLLVSLLVSSLALAHPGHSQAKGRMTAANNSRVWTDASGEFEVRGTFVAVNDGHVQIRRSDDSLISLMRSQLSESDQKWIDRRMTEIRRDKEITRWNFRHHQGASEKVTTVEEMSGREFMTAHELPTLLAQLDSAKARPAADKVPEIAKTFESFVKATAIRTRWDDRFFYIESNGIPDHRMMVGITNWQQQVPIPQAYVGDNAWRVPLNPVPAKSPVMAKNHFLRGAIAIAANGVPIFNPLNNRGEDALLFGELDEFGGHCGRADDYHYHVAPVHLQKAVGDGLPIAYALDGYPIYGYEESDGSKVKGLDALNGHKDEQGRYHYHATKTYPYLNGGFYGVVTERGGQVDPQPRTEPIRPDGRPLREAKITDFVETKPGSYRLSYEVRGKKASVSYVIGDNGSAMFSFVDTNGTATTETYSPKRRGPAGGDRQRPLPPREPVPPRAATEAPRASRTNLPQLEVTSSAVDANGNIAAEFTCDGVSASPAVEWSAGPAGTKCFALSLWHIAPDQEKSYWIIYNIPADVRKIAKNAKEIGKPGLNDKRRAEYEPMCSKGPGRKTYHLTVYALSAEPKLAADKATRANLLAAIKGITLAEGTLDFQYERKK